MSNMPFDWNEVDTLITILQMHGIKYLVGNGTPINEDEKIDPVSLLQRLARCGYPLVENACISLFILHPELASAAIEALRQSNEQTAETLSVLILATLYMQQWWVFPLTFGLGHLPSFPEEPFTSLWKERNLPSPDTGYGRTGFLALQEYEQKRYGHPFNVLHDWQNQIDHLIRQEEAYHRKLSAEVLAELQKLSII